MESSPESAQDTMTDVELAPCGERSGDASIPMRIGRFAVRGRIGAGAMGVVLAAHDEVLERDVAVKLVRADRLGGAPARSRLLREAKVLARVSHPNVVGVFDAGALDDGRVWIAMELVHGATLRAWLAARPRSQRVVLEVYLQAARGLAAAHAADIVHRDFKPENAIVGDEPGTTGRVRVLDFGIARPSATDRSDADDRRDDAAVLVTRTGPVQGTPAYMAPEQHLGQPVDARSDQFAFCVALWEALAGERPFAGATLMELTMAVLEHRIRTPARRLPRGIERVLRRGLAVDREDRWPTMAALVTALERASRRPRAPWIAAAVIGGVLLPAAVLFGRGGATPCRIDDGALAGVWDDDRRAAIAAAFAATAAPWADETRRTLDARIDAYAQAWVAMMREACEATHVLHVQSEELLDRRVACLDARRDRLRSVTDVLLDADAELALRSTRVLGELEPLAPCGDLEFLGARVALPADPEARSRIAALRERLESERAAALSGDPEGALQRLLALRDDIDAVDYAPLRAEAAIGIASLTARTGAYAPAKDAYLGAIEAAAEGGDDRIGALAAISMAWLTSTHAADPGEAVTWVRVAEAAVRRAGDDADLRANLELTRGGIAFDRGDFAAARQAYAHAEDAAQRAGAEAAVLLPRIRNNLANVELTAGDPVQAEVAYRDALTAWEGIVGRDHPDLALVLDNLGVAVRRTGRIDEAIALHGRALALQERAFGGEHRSLAPSLGNLGTAFEARGDLDAAERAFRRALAIDEAAHGSEHPDVASSVDSLGALRLRRGDAAGARELHGRALAIREATLGPDHPDVAISLTNLGSALLAAGDPVAARDVLRRAVAIDAKVRGPDHRDNAAAVLALGQALAESGAGDDARAQLERGLVLAGPTPDPMLADSVADARARLAVR